MYSFIQSGGHLFETGGLGVEESEEEGGRCSEARASGEGAAFALLVGAETVEAHLNILFIVDGICHLLMVFVAVWPLVAAEGE